MTDYEKYKEYLNEAFELALKKLGMTIEEYYITPIEKIKGGD